MIVGVLLSSVSGFFTSRFGKSPRPDELIDKTFKGLDDRFQIFHYRSSIPHLLVGPAGLWSIIPTFIDGEIIYEEDKKNWRHKRNSVLNKLLQKEYFPNPLSEYKHHQKELEKVLKEKINFVNDPELKMLLLLLNKNVVITGISEKDNISIMPYEKVKDRFRKLAKNNNHSENLYTQLSDLLEIK
jgi:hypothetical protein